MGFYFIYYFWFDAMIYITVNFMQNVVLHLLQKKRMNFTHPKFSEDLDFFHIFVALLEMKKIEDITKDINYWVLNSILKARNLTQLIDDLKILGNNSLALKFKDSLPDHRNNFLFPARKRTHLQVVDKFWWGEMVDIP